ncbi:MAG: transglutaminase family protein [Bacteroidia bacterium]|nr:transglutaminase family protein [Bacteroidia bacterium]
MPVFYIRHRTHYRYSSFVIDAVSEIKLYPLEDEFQKVIEQQINVTQQPVIHTLSDYFGNTTGFFSLIVPHEELWIESLLAVEMLPKPELQRNSKPGEVWDKIQSDQVQFGFHDYVKAEQATCELDLKRAVGEIMKKDKHPLDSILALSEYIYKNFTYEKGVTTVETNIDEIWKLKAGVCQDFAHLLLFMVRLMGVPSRYVSGYICPGSSTWRGEGATHAWAEVWLPEAGWVGIDPTNKCMAGERHVRVATGRNFSDCTPVKGTYKGALKHTLEVTVKFSTISFDEAEAIDPVFISKSEGEDGVPKNSYLAYLQMQQQQQ